MSEPTLSAAAAVRLITAREITIMLRSKTVRFVTALILLVIAATVVILTILTATGGSATSVGITRSETSFTGPNHEQEDDITLVSLQRSPSAWLHGDPELQGDRGGA